MKHIMISIKPEYVEKILRGKKTIEIRKSMPKDLPCKVYIYESKGREFPFSVHIDTIARDNASRYLDCMRGMPDIRTRKSKYGEIPYIAYGRMKVVAEFILSYVECWRPKGLLWNKNIDKTCLTIPQLCNYAESNKKHKEHCYAWHIEDLHIYDTPKELTEFGLKRPFQSWGYLNDE